MKAWYISTVYEEFGNTVVFAENVGKAKSVALSTDCCIDAEYTEVRARRCPKADKKYRKGKKELDWYDPKDRYFLVKELGFRCEEVFEGECSECSAQKVCEAYADYLKNMDEFKT